MAITDGSLLLLEETTALKDQRASRAPEKTCSPQPVIQALVEGITLKLQTATAAHSSPQRLIYCPANAGAWDADSCSGSSLYGAEPKYQAALN